MTLADPVTVFIVDDHEIFRDGLKEALAPAEGIEVIGESDRVHGTTDLIVQLEPDVAVIDIRLPDGSGVQLCEELYSLEVDTRSLMFTSSTDKEPLYQSILAGASGYLLKHTSAKEIVNAIRTVGAGQVVIDPALANFVLEKVRQQDRVDPNELTAQENRVLELLGEGLSNMQIAERLNLAEQTVKNYVSNLTTKLDLNRTQAALYSAALRRDKDASG